MMLSRSLRSWNRASIYELAARKGWANCVDHMGTIQLLAHWSSGGEIDRQLTASPESSTHDSSSKWEQFKPRHILSRISNYFRSSIPRTNTSWEVNWKSWQLVNAVHDECDGPQRGDRQTYDHFSLFVFVGGGRSLTNKELETPDSFVVFVKSEENQSMGTKELGTLLRSMGQNLTEAELQEIMKYANSNDGAGTPLDFPTFLKNMVGKMEGSKVERELITIFQDIDTDKDGIITTAELRQALSDLDVKLSDVEFEEVVRDVGVEGRLDFEDFVKAMMAQSELWK